MSRADGRVIGATKVHDSGNDAVRWDLVILGDGYTETELDTGVFAADVEALMRDFFATSPFDEPEVAEAINVWRVDVASTDSGADDPGQDGNGRCLGEADPDQVRTFFDATFCGGQGGAATDRIHRMLTANNGLAIEVADEQVPGWDVAMVLVNSTEWGGSGGSIPVASKAPGTIGLALHEIGHSAFGLADEYEYLVGCGTDANGVPIETDRNRPPAGFGEPVEPNITLETDRGQLKWRHLVADGTAVPTTRNPDCTRCDLQGNPIGATDIGLFEGGGYYHCEIFRPLFDCRMRSADQDFCDVCKERIRSTLAGYRPRKDDPMDFTVITPTRFHLGDDPNSLEGVFAGQQKEFTFDCPGVDPTKHAVLQFIVKDASGPFNWLHINGVNVPGSVLATYASANAWQAMTQLVSPNTLTQFGNVLKVESRSNTDSTTSNLDDYVIDNVVLFYKTG